MIKRYNFFLLLLILLVNSQITLKHIETHSIPIIYGDANVFGVKNGSRINSTYCTSLYNCYYDTCYIIKYNNPDYIGVIFNRYANLTCDESWIDLYLTMHNSVIISLIVLGLTMLANVLIIISVIVLIAFIRIWLRYDTYSSFVSSLARVEYKHWANPIITMLLAVGHAISLFISVCIIINTYIDMLPHMFYSTLWLELSIIILQCIHLYDNRRRLNLISNI